MKANLKTVIAFSAIATGLGLTSCVAPYDAYGSGGGSTSVTTYSTGQRFNTLPGGYRTETVSGNTYYYHNGHYYNRRSGGYVIVDAPSSSRYYSEYSRYRGQDRNYNGRDDRYDRNSRNNQTRVITRLPSGYRTVTHRGQSYYQHQNQYYRRQGSGYVTVTSPF